ncbi:MAG: hypothetical protein NC411_07350 [Bacteroides sp.]|nr:hypothetical protein [Bacteroides sp.]
MLTLDDVLAQKSNEPIKLNTATCDTAQKKIMRKYRQGALSTLIFAVVFPCAWQSGFGNDAFTPGIKIFFIAFLLVATMWYGYLYLKTKKINIAVDTPVQTMKQVASLRFCALTGEIVLGMTVAIFFTLFLSNLWIVGQYRFWIVLSAIVVFIILLTTVYLPRTIRDFKNLTALE